MSALDQDTLFAEVVTRLRKAADQDRTFDAAQMHLINLPEIIRNAGPNWPLLKDRIRAGSMTFLSGCLDPDDIVIPAGDGFLIIFARGEGPELKARAEELRQLLLAFYLGEDGLRDLGLRVEMRRVGAKEIDAILAPTPTFAGDDLAAHMCVFLPVWSARAQAIASYFCTPVRESAAGRKLGYDEGYAEGGVNGFRDYASLDLHMLDVMQEALEHQAPPPHPALAISVHSTTLQHRSARSAFLHRLAQLPKRDDDRLLVRIAEIEPGAPAITIADWVGTLRAQVPRVLLEFHGGENRPPDLSQIGGAWAVGFRAQDGLSERAAPAHALQCKRWREALTRQKLRFFVANLGGPLLAAVAAEAGADLLASATLWPPQARPGGVIFAPAPFSVARNKVSSPAT
jgi:hypothetical protein